MTYQEFFNKWNGKGINFDLYYGNQCMDLYQQYNKEVVGANISIPADPAYKVWYENKYPLNYYIKVLNTPDAIPQKGDVIIWKPTLNGGFGHIAVCDTADLYKFTSFDQNFPSQGYYDSNGNFIGTGVAHLQNHNYDNVYGWLHPKNFQPTDPLTIFKNQIRSILEGAGSDGDKLFKIRLLV